MPKSEVERLRHDVASGQWAPAEWGSAPEAEDFESVDELLAARDQEWLRKLTAPYELHAVTSAPAEDLWQALCEAIHQMGWGRVDGTWVKRAEV